ncbi:conserved membrane hypothetical protein [Syntrophobacter sp. SbD1]|nr:conserved membrane hypothetical protein [Syntrophobacter sp. SbD1]
MGNRNGIFQGIIPSSESLTMDRIGKIVLLIRRVYLTLIWGFGLAIPGFLYRLELPKTDWVLHFFILNVIYFGLRDRKHWVVQLVLIKSLTSCWWGILKLFEPAENVNMLIYKILGALSIYFFAYQVAFFTTSEVKRFFGDSGQELFS